MSGRTRVNDFHRERRDASDRFACLCCDSRRTSKYYILHPHVVSFFIFFFSTLELRRAFSARVRHRRENDKSIDNVNRIRRRYARGAAFLKSWSFTRWLMLFLQTLQSYHCRQLMIFMNHLFFIWTKKKNNNNCINVQSCVWNTNSRAY